uniref:Uncharacterized protein n=1 Tax=Anguilla anguilla TaxID=7936 RepID=A0A0E9XTF7_ANGAN
MRTTEEQKDCSVVCLYGAVCDGLQGELLENFFLVLRPPPLSYWSKYHMTGYVTVESSEGRLHMLMYGESMSISLL